MPCPCPEATAGSGFTVIKTIAFNLTFRASNKVEPYPVVMNITRDRAVAKTIW